MSMSMSMSTEANTEIVEPSTSTTESKRRLSNDENAAKKSVKRSRKRSPIDKKNETLGKTTIPIFTDAFLDLFRKQKSEIRSLKLNYNDLSERFKLKDAQQEQIRLNNNKMRLDIEEISQKNYFLKSQIDKIQQELKETFHQDQNKDFLIFLTQHQNDQQIKNNIQKIVKSLQL